MSPQGEDDRAAKLKEAIALKRAAARLRAQEETPDSSAGSALPRRPAHEPAALSELQRSLWVLHELHPDSAEYNVASCLRLRGRVNGGALESALRILISRHRILRSTYLEVEGKVQQEIAEDSVPPISAEQVSGAKMQARAETLCQVPFDLKSGPLLRLTLLEDPKESLTCLVLAVHHIIADEQALRVLWEELSEAYRNELSSENTAPQFDDYIFALEAQPDSGRDEALAFWKGKLSPLPEPFQLPYPPPERAVGRAAGQLLRHEAGEALRDEVQQLAVAHGTTPFTVYAFAYQLLLQRYADGARVAFATPSSQRNHLTTERMIGYFLNAVVIQFTMDEERTASASLRAFSPEWRARLGHGHVPFDALVERLDVPRQAGVHPLFQTMFVAQTAEEPPRFGPGAHEFVQLDLGVSKFDLTLFVSESPASVEFGLEFRTSLLEEWQGHNLLAHYETLLHELLRKTDRPLRELSLLSETETARLQGFASGTSLATAEPALMPTRIRGHFGTSASSLAATCGSESWTYAELESAASSIASALNTVCVGPGDRVALYLPRSCELIAAIVGVQLVGAAYVPLDPTYPEARNLTVVTDAEVSAIVVGKGLDWTGPPLTEIRLDSADSAVRFRPESPPSPSSPAYLLYTSGSTGKPKGVVVSQRNLALSNAARDQVYGNAPQRFLLLSSVAFDSSVAGIFSTLANGGTLVLPQEHEANDVEPLAELIERQEVTMLLCVPSLYAALLTEKRSALRSLKTVIVAGEACPRQLVADHFEGLPNARLFNEYGPTEATVWATYHEFEREDWNGPVTIGRPIPGVELEVRDSEERLAPHGALGEAWVVGPTVTGGYWNRPDLTVERFTEASYSKARAYATGDRVSWTQGGELLFHGRIDEQIKVRGVRVEPGEIESVLLELPGVEEAVVVAQESAAGNVVLAAFLRGESLSEETVAGSWPSLQSRLPQPMIPARHGVLPEFPRLPNGKVDRAALRKTALVKSGAKAERTASTLEQSLLVLWRGLLGQNDIELDDNLFELGGHSLLVVEMARVLRKDFAAEITPADIFQNPTVQDLARVLDESADPNRRRYNHLFPIQPRGSKAPILFCIPHFFTAGFAAHFRGERPVYGLRGVGLRPEGNLGRWRDMGELSDEICAEIKDRFGSEPCIVAGYSFGGSMAFETAKRLEAMGIRILRLILIAPMPLDFRSVGPLRLQLDALRSDANQLASHELRSALLRTYGPKRLASRLWRGLAIKNYRRALRALGKRRLVRGQGLTPGEAHADVRLDRFALHSTYEPAPITVPTLFFNPNEPETDAAATWKSRFLGPLQVLSTPDPHGGEAAYLEAQAEILALLDRELEN